jgi:hypothetical protein
MTIIQLTQITEKKNKKKYLKFAFYIPELSLKKDEAFLFESG